MCHPGRPLPHGESHAGSPGRDAFHRAKSQGARFSLKPKLIAPGGAEPSRVGEPRLDGAKRWRDDEPSPSSTSCTLNAERGSSLA